MSRSKNYRKKRKTAVVNPPFTATVFQSLMPPLLHKDVLMGLRKKRSILLQMLFLTVCFSALWALWPEGGIYSLSSYRSQHLFTVLGLGQLALVTLFAPAFVSPAFTMEKERNTFDVLYGTKMSPFAIVWGKIAGALSFLLMVILTGIPFVSMCVVLGGISREAVLWFYIVLVASSFIVGSIGLFISYLSTKTYRSVIVTYVIVFVLSFLTVIPSMMFISGVGGTAKSVLHYSWSLSPFVAMLNVVQPEFIRSGIGTVDIPEAHTIFAFFSLIVGTLLLLFIFFRLRLCPSPVPQRENITDQALKERLTRWPFYLLNPKGRRRLMGRMWNPVFIKEMRTMLFGRLAQLLRGFYACWIISILLVLMAAFGAYLYAPSIIAVFTISFQMTLILFMGPIFSAPLISREVENQRFDLLRLTRLSSFTIVSGKYQSVIIPVVLLLIATLPPYFALGYVDRTLITGILRSSATLLATLIFICSAGVMFSSFAKRTSSSIAATYVVVVATCVLSLIGLLARQHFSHDVLQTMFVVNPIVVMLSEIALPELRETFRLWLPNIYFLIIAAISMLFVAVIRVSYIVRPAR